MAVDYTTDNELKGFIAANKVAVIKFWAEWCKPCTAIKGKVHDIETKFEGKAAFAHCNLDELEEGVSDNFEVETLPCIIVFQNGVRVSKSGSKTEVLEEVLARVTAEGKAALPTDEDF